MGYSKLAWYGVLNLIFLLTFTQALKDPSQTFYGMGSSMTHMLYEKAFQLYISLEKPELDMVYESLNSNSGICRIKDYYTYCNWETNAVAFTDFAATEIILTEEDRQRWPDLLMLPTVAQAVVVVVNMPDYEDLAPNIRLDRDTISRIFSGNITRWNDPALKAIQYHLVGNILPDEEINLVVRGDVSGTTQSFKRALSRFRGLGLKESPVEDPGTEWPGLDPSRVQRLNGNMGVALGVSLTPFSLGYVDLSTALMSGIRLTDFVQETGDIISPSMSSVEYAMFEDGVVLEPDNTADISNAQGINAWPISTYSYVVLRTNSKGDRLRQGSTCAQVLQTVKFLEWFYTSDVVTSMLREFSAVHLSKSTQEAVLEQLTTTVWCNRQRLGEAEGLVETVEVNGHGYPAVENILEIARVAYSHNEVHTGMFGYTGNISRTASTALKPDEGYLVVKENDLFQQEWFVNNQYDELHELTVGRDTYMALPYYLAPCFIAYHIPGNYGSELLKINRQILRDLFTGVMKSWDHAHLNQVNTWLADAYFDNNLVFVGIDDNMDQVYKLMASLLGLDFPMSNDTWELMVRFPSHWQVLQYVEQTPGAIAIIPHVEFDMVRAQFAAISIIPSGPGSTPVLPTLDSVTDCVGPNSYNPVTFEFTIDYTSKSTNVSGCYPLVYPIYIVGHFSYADHQEYCEGDLAMGKEANGFLRFLFLSGKLVERTIIHELGLPLTWTAGHASHIQRVQQVLEYIPCGFPRPPPETVDNTLLTYVIFGSGAVFIVVCCCLGFLQFHHRRKRLKLNPLYGINVQKVLESIIEELKSEVSGEVATYIPQLARVDPDLFAIALMTTEGKLYAAGDHQHKYSIQSMSKPFLYAQAIEENGFEVMHNKVGVEPSGGAFNSEKMDPHGRPFNPYINAGAIACVGLLPFGEKDQRYEEIRQFMSAMSYSGDLDLCQETYYSESSTADQNRVIGKVLLENNIIATEYDMEHGLEAYFMACSTLVTTCDMATMAGVLAHKGAHPVTNEQLIQPKIVDEVKAVMMTCGMYNGAGNWMVDVGIPAKSGVAGGIMACVPDVCGLAVFSPRLNANYNSVRGMLVCAELSVRLGLHLMNKSSGTEKSAPSTKAASQSGQDPSKSNNSVSKSSGHKAITVAEESSKWKLPMSSNWLNKEQPANEA